MSDVGTEKLAVDLLALEIAGNFEEPELAPEAASEARTEAPNDTNEQAQSIVAEKVAVPVVVRQAVASTKDPVLQGVEDILSKGIAEIYSGLSPDKKPIFRAKGEEVAHKIKAMIEKGKVKVHAILKLIKEWLHTIPGINKFFLEQEAKIKTDLIIAFGTSRAGHSMNAI